MTCLLAPFGVLALFAFVTHLAVVGACHRMCTQVLSSVLRHIPDAFHSVSSLCLPLPLYAVAPEHNFAHKILACTFWGGWLAEVVELRSQRSVAIQSLL